MAPALGATALVALVGVSAPAEAVWLDVPLYSQCDGAWGSDALGTCTETMCEAGCAVTSSAMLYEYYGGQLDPAELNECLRQNGGYAQGCLIYWSNACLAPGMSYAGSTGDIDAELAAGRPVIAQVSTATISMHFVVIVGNEAGDYQIRDPYPPHPESMAAAGYSLEAIQLYDGEPARSCEATVRRDGETIIDELDGCFVRHGSYWEDAATGYEGHHYYTYAIAEAAPDCWAEWRFAVEEAGAYEIYAYLADELAASRQARYVVTHADGEEPIVVDQSTGGGWRSLGRYSLAVGGGQRVALYDNTGEPVGEQIAVGFDAVQVSPVDEPGGAGGAGGAGGVAGSAAGGSGGDPADAAGLAGSNEGCGCALAGGRAPDRGTALGAVIGLFGVLCRASRRRAPTPS